MNSSLIVVFQSRATIRVRLTIEELGVWDKLSTMTGEGLQLPDGLNRMKSKVMKMKSDHEKQCPL